MGMGGRMGGTMFQKQQSEAKPWLCLRASVQHPSGHGNWFLSLAGLSLMEPRYLCMAFICIGLSKQFVLK